MTGAFPRDVSDADADAACEVDVVSGGGAAGAAARGVPTRDELRKQLLTHRIAGAVATPREDNLRKYAMFAERDPYHLFGLEPERVWRLADVVKLMAERAGVSGDLKYRSGQDHIDVELTLDALDRFADRLAKAAERRERVLLATGHPSTLLAVHLALATALREAGCEVIEAGAGWSYQASAQLGAGRKRRSIAYFGGVGVLAEGGSLVHTHSARPIRAALASLAGDGEPLPDLVVADHGWCGGAGQAGIDAIGFADSNDPALFVGEAEGGVQVAVP
ncbi:MAG: phosphatase, partial [Catenulispora sp.]|nr:phosphatase [Catenulispora sp.]